MPDRLQDLLLSFAEFTLGNRTLHDSQQRCLHGEWSELPNPPVSEYGHKQLGRIASAAPTNKTVRQCLSRQRMIYRSAVHSS